MNIVKKITTYIFLLSYCVINAQYTDQINSNRPGLSVSAFAVGKTIAQVETGIYGIMEKHSILNYETRGMGVDLSLRYGAFMEELEFVVDMQYQFDQQEDALYITNRNDFKQFTVGAKYLIYDPDKNYKPELNLYSWKANHKFKWRNLIPAFAVYGGVNLIGGDNPYTFPEDQISAKIAAITQNHFGKWVWVNNIIFDKFPTDYPSIGVISTLTRGFNEKWSGFIEFQGFSSDYYADGLGRLGAAHLLSDTMQIDASITGNFKDTPSILYGSIGFSWRFDANYKDILVAGKGEREDEYNEEQKKKKEKKDKEREERKKKKNQRLDEVELDGN
ncbi:transporter [Flavobacterium arcticum]|uniref:Transporter n=1 Tax=Flavobacterium arcticum TaxID=1784713 RepID=A0A345HFC4_9FLAO|nr:transporter [Flavobacterium arcticum]AXG75284.1 transporter [Flavobacterium arcticum]KAF2512244.1 transporter [Flavobacterium arcticum]